MSEDAYEVAISFIGEEMREMKPKYEKGGKVNMCQGLREWMEDERAEGKAEGEDCCIRNLMKNLQITREEALILLGVQRN